jgi:hypothetical protein
VHGKTKPALSKDWAGELHDWVKKKGPAAWLPSPYSWSCLNIIHLVKIHNKCMHYANVANECQYCSYHLVLGASLCKSTR